MMHPLSLSLAEQSTLKSKPIHLFEHQYSNDNNTIIKRIINYRNKHNIKDEEIITKKVF